MYRRICTASIVVREAQGGLHDLLVRIDLLLGLRVPGLSDAVEIPGDGDRLECAVLLDGRGLCFPPARCYYH